MDSSFLKLVTGTRVKNYLGLVMDPGKKFVQGKNYLYLELPVSQVVSEAATESAEDRDTSLLVKRNQHVFIDCGGTIDVKGPNMASVEPNPALAAFGQVQAGWKVHPDSGQQTVGFWFTARKDTDLSKVAFGARLYLHV